MLWNGGFIRWKNGGLLRGMGIEWNESEGGRLKIEIFNRKVCA